MMGGGVKHYSPGEIMTDRYLNANNLKLSFGVYCQVAENAEPRNSFALINKSCNFLGQLRQPVGWPDVPCIEHWTHYHSTPVGCAPYDTRCACLSQSTW
jgi:hypothetical protein